MAKWIEVSDETVKAFDDVLLSILPEQYGVAVKIIVDNSQKTVIELKKVPPMYKFSYGDDLIIIVNEAILDAMPPVEQNLYIQEQLSGVRFDAENDRLLIDKTDVNTYDGFIERHGYEKHKLLRLSVESLYELKKEQDLRDKEAAKASGNE